MARESPTIPPCSNQPAKVVLGAVNNHHNQTDWAQGSVSDSELVNEDGIARFKDAPPFQAWQENQRVAREAGRQAEAMKRRKGGAPARDPGEIQPGNLRLIGGVLAHVVGVAR